jgi:hypothetical protein
MINDNIYADLGSEIKNKERYIRRKNIESIIYSRIIANNFAGSISLSGLNRIGKSTIALQELILKKNELAKSNILVVDTCLSTYDDAGKFFKNVGKLIYKELEKNKISNTNIEELYKKNIGLDYKNDDLIYNLQDIIEILTELEIKIILIIDEFDSAIKLFEKKPNYFQTLREFTSSYKYNVSILFISRRLIEYIEEKVSGVSNLANTLISQNVTMYNEDEIEQYFNILKEKYFKKISEEAINTYKYLTGFHPYFMDILSFYLIEAYKENNLSKEVLNKEAIIGVFNKQKIHFYENFKKLTEILKEEKLLDKLIEILFGPIFSVTKEDIEKLHRYGIILKDNAIDIEKKDLNDNKYLCFSTAFYDYLSEKKEELITNLIIKTETNLRQLVENVLEKKYGKHWIEKLKENIENSSNEYLKKGVEKAERNLKKDFNNQIKYNFLKFTEFGLLIQIIDFEWTAFENIFESTKEKIDKKILTMILNYIRESRNFVFHCNEDLMTNGQKKIFEGYCEKINIICENCFKQIY